MKKRLLSTLLSVSMLLALCACGGGSGSTPAADSGSAPASETAQTSEKAPETPATPASDAEDSTVLPVDSAAAEPTDPTEIDASGLYPVFDELTTVTAFLNIAPWASAYIGPNAEFENAYAILAAEEYTNVHLDVDWSDPDTYNEKLNLLVAANDLPNFTRSLGRLYSTGEDGLIEDGLAVDLYPYFEEYAPNYYAILESNAKFKEDATSSSGVTTAMYSYTEIPLYSRGPIVRKDMLDAVNKEIPTTVDELHDVALALKNEYGVKSAVVSPKMVADAYAGVDFISSNDVLMTWWNIDGTVTAAVTLDSNYEWAKEMKQWNDEGLFVESWYNPAPFYDFDVLNDQLAIAYGPYNLTSDSYRASAASPDTCEIYPMANVVLKEGDTIKTQNNAYGGKGDGDWTITTADEDIIPQLVSYVNWFFTEEGSMISNFGKLDETYTIDDNGDVHYTDLILKDPNGYGSMAVYAIFTNNNDNPFYFRLERTELTYDNDVEATVYDTWLSNMTSEYICNYQMTTEESTRYNAIATDVMTVIQEYMTKFMTGDMELSEDSWQAFQDKLESLGIDEMREIVQTAFDRTNGQ